MFLFFHLVSKEPPPTHKVLIRATNPNFATSLPRRIEMGSIYGICGAGLGWEDFGAHSVCLRFTNPNV